MNIGYSNRYYAGQLARYYYRKGLVGKCYRELIRSEFTWKNLGLFLTAWNTGLRNYVLDHFKVSDYKGR
jgi:hypothetical protein